MEEKRKSYIKKETIIAAVIGFLIGVVAIVLVGWSFDFVVKSEGLAKLKYGEDAIATVNGKAVSTQTVYDELKRAEGLNVLLNEADKLILNEKYTLSPKEQKEAEAEADYYIEYNKTMGGTEEEFLKKYGFNNYEEFVADVGVNIKYTKYLCDYLEPKLEAGAVQKYYDENKDTIETYDTEHILVKISDTVTDEQALALANEIIGKLNEGKAFSEVVEEYGDKITHEELGYNGKTSNLQQTYIDEMIALKDGEYSKTPVKTTYGYHVVHKIATSTLEDLRAVIIDTLSTELFQADQYLTDKALVELRKENSLTIYDEDLKSQYEEYCETLYKTEE